MPQGRALHCMYYVIFWCHVWWFSGNFGLCIGYCMISHYDIYVALRREFHYVELYKRGPDTGRLC